MAAGKTNFSAFKGDSFKSSMTLTSPTGTAINLTGATVSGKVGTQDFTCTVTNAAQGKFKIELTPVQTQTLEKINTYGVQITYSDGFVQTILTGQFVTEDEVV